MSAPTPFPLARLVAPVLAVVAVVLAAVAGFVLGEHAGRPTDASASALGTIRPAPRYELTNQLQQPVSSNAFAGKVQIVTFLFPYCTTYCPLIASNLVRFEGILKAAGIAQDVRLVTFNLDPGGSGPAQMRAFMQEYGWNPRDPHWQFLTGTPATIRQVVSGGYMVDYARESLAEEAHDEALARARGDYVPEPEVENDVATKANVNYDIVHNDMMELVGPRGNIRKIYDAAERVPDDQLLDAVDALKR